MAKKKAVEAPAPIEGREAGVGTIVNYVMPSGYARPAIVTGLSMKEYGMLNLRVFTNGEEDGYPADAVPCVCDVAYDDLNQAAGTWHFIEG